MDNARHSVSSVPVVSKLDHLDFVMKNLEKQHHLTKWANDTATHGSAEEPFRPVDTAVRDTYFKGSLLERVAALENRLFQLCLELESTGTPTNSTGESSSQRSKREFLRTLPTFNINPKHDSQTNAKSEIQEICEEEEKGEEVEKKKESEKNSQTIKKKKGSLYKWPHFKLLGC